MKLLDSLLDAIVRLEGDALVMHVGEKPYVITASASMNAYRGPLAWGQVELSSRVLTFDAVSSMLSQILPADQQLALAEFGAIEHEILPPDGILDRFTVVAARGGEDVWVEVRRKPMPTSVSDTPEPEAEAPAAAPAAVETEPAAPPAVGAPVAATAQSAAAEPVAAPEPVAVAEPPAAEPIAQPESYDLTPTPETAAAAPEIAPPIEPEPELESITVSLPGEAGTDVSLDAVSEDAIHIVDDEPQDLPTEAEVDAMMAATASALLSSALTIEEVRDDEPAPVKSAEARVSDTSEGAEADGFETIDLDEEPAPAFELAPPPIDMAPAEEPLAVAEERPDTPVGTPLFAAGAADVTFEPAVQVDPATLIDAPAPIAQEAPTIPEVAAPLPAIEPIAITPPAFEPVVSEPELEPAIPAAEPPPVSTFQTGADAAAMDKPPLAIPVSAEMHMDPTPESRYADAPGMAASSGGAFIAGGHVAEPAAPVEARDGQADADADGRGTVVVPMARPPLKPEVVTAPFTPSADAALMQTLRAAAARGAATVYVVAQSKPMIRVDGEISPLESEPVLSAADVDRLVQELAPPRKRDALQHGPVEWLCDVAEVGRVRCLTFRDHRGPGVLFRMFPARAISADQLGLTPEVQALCQQSDGLVLVTGARASGKSTLLNAFVDLINRTRSDHIITVETQIGFVHESRRSFISQRETRGDAEFAGSVARAALREDPDVMMIEDLKSPDLVATAIEGAESGRLVLASVPAASTIAALERLIEVFPPDRRIKVRATLATALRGVISQVLLRRVTGGRVPAREILLNTPAVSTLLLEGKMFQLPVALDSGRRHGMVPLTDALAAHVRDGSVDVGEAYRKALDRAALVAALKRDGIDTSFAERLA